MSDNCKYHVDHESRIKNLEVSMREVKNAQINPAIWVALLSLCGTLGSVVGQILIAYVK